VRLNFLSPGPVIEWYFMSASSDYLTRHPEVSMRSRDFLDAGGARRVQEVIACADIRKEWLRGRLLDA
jgi:hypothetical protein